MSEPWLGDVRAALERRIAASGASPDFLDVVARAHELDPVAVPAERLDEADTLLAQAHPEALERGSADEEARLDDWLGDVRAAVERRIDDRRDQPRPALPVHRDRRVAWWLGGMALAAAILLVLGIGQVVRVLAARPDPRPDQALRVHESAGSTGTAEAMPSADARSRRLRMERSEPIEHEAVVLPEAAPATETEAAAAAEAETPASRAVSRRPSKAERLKALADEAQRLWRAGQRNEAQRLFERIVAEGGRSRAAEMAHADLFTLASQAGDPALQRERWRTYLRRFPRGRFADDARAGLCRSAARPQRAACWAEYLDDFPRGSFRAEGQAGGSP